MTEEISSQKGIKNILIKTKAFRDAMSTYDLKKSWPFTIGDEMIPIMACAGSFYTTHYFRKEFKIRPHARFACYSPVIVISSVVIDSAHKYVFNPKIMEGSCPSCLIASSALVQLIIGAGYPLILAPIVTLHVADKLLTYPVPSLTRAPWEVFRLATGLIKKNSRAFIISAVIQTCGAIFFTWQKQVCMENFIAGR